MEALRERECTISSSASERERRKREEMMVPVREKGVIKLPVEEQA